MKRIVIFLIGALVMLHFGCSKDKDDGGDTGQNISNDSLMTDILAEIAEDDTSFMDIAPIPIQAELYDYAEVDTGFQRILEVIENFNELIGHPGILLGETAKSTLVSNWVFKGCEGFANVSECTWEIDRGTYKYTLVETTESMTGTSIKDLYISGTRNGVYYSDLDDSYLISEWTTILNNLQITITTYYAPFNEIVANQELFYYHYIAGEGRTIYTPRSEPQYVTNSVINSINYGWDYVNGHYEVISSTLEWEGSLLTTLTSMYCANYQALRTSYSSTYNFAEHEGAWCAYDCDEQPIACGSSK